MGGGGGVAYDALYKIVLVGNSGVGKSSLILRFTNDTFTFDSQSTVGVEFVMKTVLLEDGLRVKTQIWDTAGQERYQAMTRAYYRGAVGAMVVFDLTQRETYEAVPKWLVSLKQAAGEEINVLLVANKSDLVSERCIEEKEARGLAKTTGALYVETSAKDNTGVDETFTLLCAAVAQRLELGRREDALADVYLTSSLGSTRLDDMGANTVSLGGAAGAGDGRGGMGGGGAAASACCR